MLSKPVQKKDWLFLCSNDIIRAVFLSILKKTKQTFERHCSYYSITKDIAYG